MKKEDFLGKVRKALENKNEVAPTLSEGAGSLAFRLSDNDLAVAFAKEFTQRGGTMLYCATEEELATHIATLVPNARTTPLACGSHSLALFLQGCGFAAAFTPQHGQRADMGIFLCEALQARDGSVTLSDRLGYGTAMPSLPPTTLILAFTSQLTRDWEATYQRLGQAYPNGMPNEIAVLSPTACPSMSLILMEDQ